MYIYIYTYIFIYICIYICIYVYIRTGGMDNAAFIVDSVTGAQLNKLTGHTKKVTAVGCYQGDLYIYICIYVYMCIYV
jgi:hypothetical protein